MLSNIYLKPLFIQMNIYGFCLFIDIFVETDALIIFWQRIKYQSPENIMDIKVTINDFIL